MAGKRRTTRRGGPRRARSRRLRAWGVAALAALAVVVVGVAAAVLIRGSGGLPSDEPPGPVVREAVAPPQPAPRPTEVIGFADGCMTADCHGPMAVRAHVHQTFADEACDLCHAPDTGGHVYPQLSSTEGTCTSCHDTGADHRFQHKAMSEEACLACHDPHASDSPSLLVEATVDATCVRCHPRDRGAFAHEPYVTDHCGECHDPHGADNPMLVLGGEGEDNCRLCHAPTVVAMELGSRTHLGVEGRCLACHSAHMSRYKGLLAARPRDLCVTCHEDVGLAVSGASVSHDSVLTGEQCITCHDPHASERHAMLRDTQSHLCLSCHDKPVTAADGREVVALGSALEAAAMVHGAVTIGDCSACHSVHGGTHARLLRALNTTVFVGPYDAQNYALCFACHDRRLAESPNATLFRDGGRNLHAAHLRSGEKSGGCSDCHSVHAGDQPRLIVETVRYQGSDWATPMGFSLTAEGGRCAPGCHEPLEYSRRPGGVRAKSNGESP